MQSLKSIQVATMARAEHAAKVDRGLCNGCGLCSQKCPFNAVDSINENGRIIARIDVHKCFGCGLCRRACNTNAVSLGLR
jgi:heterodisulfide reductase subunit A